MGRVFQGFPRFVKRTSGQEFQQNRQVVGQFGCHRFQACVPIGLDQADHRAATVAAFAVDVLEQVQRQGARPVEQQDISFLEFINVRRGQRFDQRPQIAPRRSRQPGVGCQNGPDLRHGVLQLFRRIAQNQRYRFQGTVHYITSVGIFSGFLPPPNSEPLLMPVEQPLVSVKPQPPRRS